MPRKLKDFLNVHRGETAWLFGKGPSLDKFDMAQAGSLRCAINDVVKEVPGCRYCFANDPVNDWAHHYTAEHVLFTPRRAVEDSFLRGRIPPQCETVVFDDQHTEDRIAAPREVLAETGLAIRRGTLGSAGQILYLMGVRKIVCVGIDGGGAHAARQWHTRLRADHARDYNMIREAFVLACRIEGIEVEFFGSDAVNQLSNGMKTIKISENTFVRGVPYSAGEIIEVTPSEAETLVSIGRAIAWTPPARAEAKPEAPDEPAPVETAEAQPASETAVADAAKSKRRRK